MGIMVSEIYEALIAAGAPEDKAKAAAEAIPVSDLLATREDIADLKADTKQDIADTRQDIAALKAEMKQAIADLKAEIKQDIARLEARMAKQDSRLSRLEWVAFAAIALLVKIAFFN
jgi:septal ring factor EnvC (AmiA/AmiB activator)